MKERAFKLIKIYLTILGAGLLYALLFSKFNIKIPCIFHSVTGYLCPSCGVSRMCIEILKGNFIKAYYYNRLIFLFLPIFFVLFVKWSIDYIKTGKIKHNKLDIAVVLFVCVSLIAFGAVRNFI